MRFTRLKIVKLGLPFLLGMLFSLNGNAQYKSFKLNDDGDTLNAIDQKDLKQGKWVNHIDELKENPAMKRKAYTKMARKKVSGGCIV